VPARRLLGAMMSSPERRMFTEDDASCPRPLHSVTSVSTISGARASSYAHH
jgi:hypothetical protein